MTAFLTTGLKYVPIAVAVIVGIILSGLLYFTVRDQERAHTQAEFERQANSHVAAIQKGIERNLEVLESIGGLFAASSVVERQDFRAFVEGPLARHQEIQALSWNQRVKDSDRASYEAATRNDGSASFQITERNAQGQMEKAGRRAEYISVAYIEPLKGNEAAVGFDVASNPTRLKALERSRDTGEIVATARITLVQESEEQFGTLILKPVYQSGTRHESVEQRRQNLTGFAVGVFRIGDLVEASVGTLPEEMVNIQLVDERSAVGERLLYLRQASPGDGPTDEEQLEIRDRLFLRAPLEMPGRQWSLLISPTPEFLGAQASWVSWGVLAGGLLITALLTAYLSMINHAVKIERLAAKLTTSNEDLEREITERTRAEEALAQQARELVRSNQELQQFASIASHDLQEPLRKVLAFGDLLEASSTDGLTEQGRDYLRRMQGAATRMKALIDDILNLSRVTTQARPFVAVDLAEIAREVVADLEVRIEETGGRVEVEDIPTIVADRTQMRQLLQNLIGNALKFHRPGEPPVVRVRGYLLDGQTNGGNGVHAGEEMLRLTVEDNGIGFDEKHVDRIFIVFQRLHGRGEYEGSGVGLAVCRKIVERHAGTITAESDRDRGSTFVATLPVNHLAIEHPV